MITVVEPGALTTVQDLGREHSGAHGVPCGGAMDGWALRAANLLVGNDAGDAALEMTLSGPSLMFERDAIVAVTGARTSLPHEEAFRVRAGELLEPGKLIDGARAILALGGGIGGDVAFGSRASLGTMPLRRGDRLTVGASSEVVRRTVGDGVLAHGSTLRALDGDDELFDTAWRVTPDASRAGVRLGGPELAGGEISPRGMVPGVVQVPPGGAPIVLGPDGPVTGGYRIAATVISADVGLLAYLRPGDDLRFKRVSLEDARRAWYVRERALLDGIEDL